MAKNTELTRANRILAALLAAVWIGAGLLAVVLASIGRRWLIVLPGILAVGYGLLWAQVAVRGRRLPWPAGLLPLKRKQR
jgi:hypothetical protein